LPQSEHSGREREPGSYAIYKKTGVFPEQTMFYKELQLSLKPAGNPDGSRTEPSGRGYFPGALADAEVSARIRSALPPVQAGGADFDRHPARGHDLRHGGSAVRTQHARDLRRSNRTPDRARAGTVEALCRDGGIIPGENILKVNVYITSVEMFPALNEVYRRYFPKDPRGFSSTSLPGTAGSTSR